MLFILKIIAALVHTCREIAGPFGIFQISSVHGRLAVEYTVYICMPLTMKEGQQILHFPGQESFCANVSGCQILVDKWTRATT